MKSSIAQFLYLPFGLLFSAASLHAAADPVTDCRQAHSADPAAHIACLEAALKARSELTSPAPVAASESSSVLGSEQVQQQKRASGEAPDQQVTVRIIAVRYDSAGLGVFKLDNGQIWRETEDIPEHMRLDPGRQYQATLGRGTLGGYRMQVEGLRRMLKVKRLK